MAKSLKLVPSLAAAGLVNLALATAPVEASFCRPANIDLPTRSPNVVDPASGEPVPL